MKNDLGTILKPLEEPLSLVEREIRERLASGVPEIDEAARYLFDLGGKRIRASLVLMTAGLGGTVPEGAITLAAASEMIHAATLIHDDIIDQSIMRRGSASVPQKWGSRVAVLLGDFLYTLALDMALSVDNSRVYSVMVGGTKSMVSGELYQLHYSNIDNITRDHYYRIIELKTARFMAACTRIGGEIGNMSEAECGDLYEFGMNLGFAFQIIDDTLDLMTDSEAIGKDIRSDVRTGKITLPFLFLMERNGESAGLLRRYIREPEDALWDSIMDLMRKSSSLDTCIGISKEYVERAVGNLDRFPESRSREMLLELSSFFVSRNF
ncbi:MAG: polyprenyl synthetase family protein [Spirochaetes bacterium]|nr:polyprenyl synthetase family protein [Spirochaetota bacterium]